MAALLAPVSVLIGFISLFSCLALQVVVVSCFCEDRFFPKLISKSDLEWVLKIKILDLRIHGVALSIKFLSLFF